MSAPQQIAVSDRRLALVFGAGIALASAAVVVWRAANIAILVDLSYVLNNAYRIAAGDVPYRDFPLPYPPLTFVVQAVLIKLFGPHYLVHAAYAVILDAAAAAITFWIVDHLVRDARVAAAICLPLVVLGIQDIYPHPFYDADAAFLILCGIALALWAYAGTGGVRWILAGAVVPLSALAKQNTGVAFLVLMLAGVVIGLLARRRRRELSFFLAGAVSSIATAAVWLENTAGLGMALHWTVGVAAARLETAPSPIAWLSDPGATAAIVATAIGVFVWAHARASMRLRIFGGGAVILPYAVIAGAQLSAPRSNAILSLWPLWCALGCIAAAREIARRRLSPRALVPFVCAGVATAGFLSQGVWGSSYALWPLLLIALAVPLRAALDRRPADRVLRDALVPIASALILVAASAYELSDSRFSFMRLEGEVARSSYPPLAGLSTPGRFTPDLDQILSYIDGRIPNADAIVTLPGEDPLYFALSRRPAFPVVEFDPTTDPYSAEQLRAFRDERHIRWIIVKTDLQSPRLATLDAKASTMIDGFILVDRVGSYSVYRRP